MKIVWDPPKREWTLRKRGLDFADLDLEFFAAAEVLPGYEGRLMAIGKLGGVTLTVIFRPLGSEAISIVSMRRASRKERRL